MADWEEVRRLAADFQRVQATSTAHRLSDRNCIELVGKLLELGLVEVLYTVDGKEYVTPQHLEREIRDELCVHRGRINIVDLQQILNVDLTHVETRVTELLKHDRSLVLLQGQLMDRTYIDRLCEEVNDTLQESGQVSIANLSKNFGLPTDFLLENIESCLGTKIKGQLDKSDSGVIYTDAYVSRYRARVRGLFRAITRPTTIGPLISQGGFQEKIFHSVLHELISSGQLAGSLHGRLDKAVYIPNVYTRMQNKWADSFLNNSGYLEYDALTRLGIDDPKGYITSRYSGHGDIIQLQTCCVGQVVLTEIEAALEEIQSSGGWLDTMLLLPTPCTENDATLLLHHMCGNSTDLTVFGSVVTSKTFLENCFEVFQPLLKERAQEAASSNSSILTEMSTREAQQEVSQKRKKGGRGRRVQESKDEGMGVTWKLHFMSNTEVARVLSDKFPECSEDFVAHLAKHLQSPLQHAFQVEAKACLETVAQGGPSAGQQRKRHANLQERVQGLWNSVNLFDKAISCFEGDSGIQLSRYLLRTLCSDLTNMVVAYLAEDHGITVPPVEEMNPKERSKAISNLPDHLKKSLTAVSNSLTGKEVGPFLVMFEELCGEDYCGLMLRKLDKKKERQLLFSHQQSLLDTLRSEQEPAMALHLVSVLLFQQKTNCIIHAPGKLVPHIISFLDDHMSKSDHSKLVQYQQLVVLQVKLANKGGSDSAENVQPVAASADSNVSVVMESEGETQVLAEKGEDPTDLGSSDPSAIPPDESESESVARQLRELLDDLKQLVVKPKSSRSND